MEVVNVERLHAEIEKLREAVILARKMWMDDNPVEDGVDHVTPFDKYLYSDHTSPRYGYSDIQLAWAIVRDKAQALMDAVNSYRLIIEKFRS